ncbi:unnamed protein product [Rhizoctonia solani]|uniref:DSBA-like thioredoxin domain-containing protein n=1 Tax=Rhizoctonia solani TaxID=456999 RepID=A0A8H3CK58_9AGAM|nr:unnamed protein product [Rhizoctonia solani]
MPETVQVKFYFDIASPFSYIGLERLFRHEKAWKLSIELCPIHLATIIMSSENFPPFSSSSLKQKYMVMDIKRSAQELHIPFNLQLVTGLPASSFDNMAILKALKTFLPQEAFSQVIRELYATCFGNTTLPDDIFIHLNSTHIPQDVLDKAKLAAQTEGFRLAFEKEHADLVNNHGAFGLPWIIVQKPGDNHFEYFWGVFISCGQRNPTYGPCVGSERMSSIAHWLGPSYEYNSKLETEA